MLFIEVEAFLGHLVGHMIGAELEPCAPRFVTA